MLFSHRITLSENAAVVKPERGGPGALRSLWRGWRQAVPLREQEQGRQRQRYAQPKKDGIPDIVPLADDFVRPAGQRDAEYLANRAAPVDDAAGSGRAFLGAEVDRGGAGHQRIGDIQQETDPEKPQTEREAALAGIVGDDLAGIASLPEHRLRVEQSNTSVTLGERLMLKLYRLAEPGVNPEVETA